jgi:hypothetical protein
MSLHGLQEYIFSCHLEFDWILFGESLLHPLNYGGELLNPLNYKTVYSTPELSKTGQITPQTVLSFSFLFILAESLKNHSKSQKNHKMKNIILLDFTWVDLHSEYIIWYALVQQNWSPNYKKKKIKINNKNFVLNHIVLYVHCVDLLMWSPTKLDFFYFMIFLWFTMIFQRFSRNK